MTLIEKMLMLHEGLKQKPYLDTMSKLTIGVGRNLTDKGISQEEAQLMLQNDLLEVRDALRRNLPWTATLDVTRYSVLQDMSFNLGLAGLLKFPKFLSFVQHEDWDAASEAGLQSKWARQVPSRATRLMEMMRTGEIPTELA
jgi:lysozyme